VSFCDLAGVAFATLAVLTVLVVLEERKR